MIHASSLVTYAGKTAYVKAVIGGQAIIWLHGSDPFAVPTGELVAVERVRRSKAVQELCGR